MLVLIGSYLLLVFVLPVALSLLVSYRSLHQGHDCPHCRGDTIRLEAPRLDLVTRINPFSLLHRRWCLCCGWEGTSRLPRRRDALSVGRRHPGVRGDAGSARRGASPDAVDSVNSADSVDSVDSPDSAGLAGPEIRPASGYGMRSGGRSGGSNSGRGSNGGRGNSGGGHTRGRDRHDEPATGHSAATQTLDVRSLEINGIPWRVMLQCWKSTDLYFGRFVFVGPSGRLWLDAVESFSGRSENEVLDQAQSLPDGTLAGRLQRLVGE